MTMPLPSRLLATYFTLWSGGSRITSVPLEYNQIYLFHATPTATGAFRFDYSSAVSAAEIDQCQARGQRVVLTVGGANAGFNFSTRAQSDAFIASFKTMYDALGGVDGCDFNNFEAFVGSSGTEMAYIGKQLKTLYGNDFSISCPPHPGGGYAPMDRAITKAMNDAGVLDYAGPQFYDSPDLCQLATITSLLKEWVVHLGDPKKVVFGSTSNYAAGPTTAVSQQAWNTLVAQYPTMRGVFAWSTQDDAKAAYSFAKAMAPLVKPVVAPTPVPAPTPSPVPAPTPAPAGYVEWVGGVGYAKGTVVLYKPNGKFYQVVNVGASLTSDGTDPVVSTWYWAPVASPVPAPPALVVGDRVQVNATTTGTITAISGLNATVKLDTTKTVLLSTLKKI